jgi:quercetin dioxygenase-like cupin family protein
MTSSTATVAAPLVARPTLENSIWYGSALVTFLATEAMTDGAFTLQRMRLARGFAPPAPHKHGPECFYILSGEVRFWVGTAEVVASAGDFVRTLPDVWHTLQVESDEADFLVIFAPPSLAGFFRALGRPAEELRLPDGRVGPPDPARVLAAGTRYGITFSAPGTPPSEIPNLP